MLVFDKIKSVREIKGLTQEEVADQLALSTSGYSKIERGETRINIDRLQQIADILEVGIFELIPERVAITNTNIENCPNFQNTIFPQNQALQAKINQLELIINHKDELLAQKDQELTTLRSVIKLLEKQ